MAKSKKSNDIISQKMRDSNIELFRIIVMLLIIAHHYVVNSGIEASIFANPLLPSSIFLAIFGAFGKIGINCFVLITGYFMCTSKISVKKFVKLLFMILFYNIVINSMFWITGYIPFSVESFLNVLIPFRTVAQNFTFTFLLFFLCIPFLNILIHNITEKQHLKLIILVSFIYVLFGTIPSFSVSMNYVSWYIVLFFTASYLRLYPKKIFDNTKFWGIATMICFFACCASVIFGCIALEKFEINIIYFFVTDSNALLAFGTGICAFMFFKNLKIKPNKFINTVSSTCFGVLLIHANSDAMRHFLWMDIFKNGKIFNSNWLYLHAILSVLCIFIVCSFIDFLRIRFIEKPFFVFWDNHFKKISDKYLAMEEKICTKFKIGK